MKAWIVSAAAAASNDGVGPPLLSLQSSCLILTHPPTPPPFPTPQCLSWLFSPFFAGGIAFLLFLLIRTFVLRSTNAYHRSIVLLPLFTFATFWIVTFFIIAKAGMQFGWVSEWVWWGVLCDRCWF